MAATAPQELISGGKCFECYGASLVQTVELAMLAQLLTSLDPMAATDPQSLLTYGKCFECYGASIVETMRLALLDQIAGNISGGGTANQHGSGSPVGVVTPNAIAVWYRDDDTDNYRWSTGTTSADWTPVI